jgi:hypothetical protein
MAAIAIVVQYDWSISVIQERDRDGCPRFSGMTHSFAGSAAAAAFVIVAIVEGQTQAPTAASPATTRGRSSYVAAKTPWGDPDIQGVYNFSYVMSVNLERCGGGDTGRAPAELQQKGREALAAARAAEEAVAGSRRGGGGGRGGGRGGFGGGFGGGGGPCDPSQAYVSDEVYRKRLADYERQQAAGDRFANALKEGDLATAWGGTVDPNHPQRQTSLIMDPPDGRLPALTPEGNRRMMLMRSSWEWYDGELESEALVWDSPQDFDVWDRCITRGMPASMFPFRYNNGMEIIQAPGYVVLDLEMIHEARIIPVDGRAPINPAIKQWLGESRGRWEGPNTLVIETTNFKAGASMTNYGTPGAPAGNRIPTSEDMKITERITRTGPGMIEYEITTEDPIILTRPWTARFPLRDEPTYEWWEYACHEGNTAVANFITSSRAERAAKRAAAKAK